MRPKTMPIYLRTSKVDVLMNKYIYRIVKKFGEFVSYKKIGEKTLANP